MAYLDFITKIKTKLDSWVTLDGLSNLLDEPDLSSRKLYLVACTATSMYRIDVFVKSFERIMEGADLQDIHLELRLEDDRYFKAKLSSFLPPKFPDTHQGPVNLSRVFLDEGARDAYYDGLTYSLEVEDDRMALENQQKTQHFLQWFAKRYNSGPPEESS